MFFKTIYRLIQVKSIAECSKGSILQCFRPSLSYHLSLRSLICLFLVAVLDRFYCKFEVYLSVVVVLQDAATYLLQPVCSNQSQHLDEDQILPEC